ncbi:MAG TPA: glycosyltransferase [Acidimicrobiia bacterium]|nr:glycosyltransferase [Acidimicrobiia bacterium]
MTPAVDVVAPAVSVVIPAFNEAGMLRESVHDVVGGLRARAAPFEVIVVENGSTDGTRAIAAELAAHDSEVTFRALARPDYGEALRTGILAAQGAVVVIFDTDYYDLDFLDRALARLEVVPHPAIVVGSKRAPGTRDDRPWPRRLITAAFATVLRAGFGLRVSDTHGMKALDRAAVTPLARQCRNGRDLFDTELVLRADRRGLAVVELPVTVAERRPSRTPIARRAVRTVVGLVRLRILLWRDE